MAKVIESTLAEFTEETDTIKLFLYVEQILMFFLIYALIFLYNIIFSMYCLVKNSIQKLGTEYIFQMCQH